MKLLERFILGIPYLFLKKIPYAWLATVFFWYWPPLASAGFLLLVLVGLILMAWQNLAWQAKIRRENHSGPVPPIRDHPHAARLFQIRNLAFVLAGSAALGWLLNGRIGLNGLQWFALLGGFMLLYKDALLFGAKTTYLMTDKGLGIRYVPGHVDYRIFIGYHEIKQAVCIQVPESLPHGWDVLAPRRKFKQGILLIANQPQGFSKEIQRMVLISPTDITGFQAQLSRHVPVLKTAGEADFSEA